MGLGLYMGVGPSMADHGNRQTIAIIMPLNHFRDDWAYVLFFVISVFIPVFETLRI